MAGSSEQLIQLPTRLTGFSPFQLRTTGMADAYLAALTAWLPADVPATLLASRDDDDTMDDPCPGPVARSLILLWYSGRWTPLPADWIATYGGRSGTAGPISADSYQAGSQWRVAGAHPAGAQQQGFGAWSLKPTEAAP
jgi:hypothetical protein